MSNVESRKPKIRFKGFTDPWEQRKLGELADIRTGNSDLQDADENGEYPFFVRSENVERSSRYIFDCEAILVPGEGRLGEIYHYINGKFDCHQRVYKISDFNGVEGKFVLHAMRHSFKKHALANTVKATVDSIRLPTLTDFDFMTPPTSVEQLAISATLDQLDSLITLHQRKLNALKKVKKSLLEKMFPKPGEFVPEIRFKGFTDPWEQRKLGEVAEINGGNAWKSGDYSKDGNCLVVTIANVQGNPYIDDSIGNHIDIKGTTPFDLAQDDILISLTGNVGRVSRMTRSKGVLNQRVGKVISKKLIDDEYLFQIMRTDSFLDAMVSAGQGAAQMNISNSDVLNYQFKMPTLKEQKSLSILLRNLDRLITLHQRKLTALKIVKKSLLEKMFV